MTRETKQQTIDRLTEEISKLKAGHRNEINALKDEIDFWIEKCAMIGWAQESAIGLISKEHHVELLRYLGALTKAANRRWYVLYIAMPEFNICAKTYAANPTLHPAKLLMDALEDSKAVYNYEEDNDG